MVWGVDRPDRGVHLDPGDAYLSGSLSSLRTERDDEAYIPGESCPGSIVNGSYGVPELDDGPRGDFDELCEDVV